MWPRSRRTLELPLQVLMLLACCLCIQLTGKTIVTFGTGARRIPRCGYWLAVVPEASQD